MTRTRATFGCCGALATPDALAQHKCNLGRGGAAASPGLPSSAGRNPALPLAGTGSGVVETHPAPSKPAGRAAEDKMAAQLEGAGWYAFDIVCGGWATIDGFKLFVREYAWALGAGKGYRFDFAFPAHAVACEVMGGAHAAGRKRVKADVERSGLAASLGWRVVTVTPEQIATGEALALVRAAIKGGG